MSDYRISPEKGLINRGNRCRIKKVMKKARAGESITTAFLGGSITQGCNSSTPDTCYAALVHKWWVEKFPGSRIRFINAGIGGTSSQFGAARVREHVLSKKPDFILTEFAVNDENDPFFCETYEGLVRAILSDESAPALLLMNNVFYDTGINAEDQHLPVARHYDLPMVSMKQTIFAEVQNNQFSVTDISTDGLHPNDAGHELVASVIIDLLEKIRASLDEEEDPAAYEKGLPAPLTENAYEDSLRIKNYNTDADGAGLVLKGFVPDLHEKKEYLDIFSGGFTATGKGESIELSAFCTGIAVQYRKSVRKPAPVAAAVIDDDTENPVILDANFDEDWGDCLYIETVAKHLPPGEHKVSITLTQTHEDDTVPFYLVSFIISGRNKA